jgi:hypothetical protein
MASASYDRLRDLELEVDGYTLDRRELEVSSGFKRVTHTVCLEGGGERGQGEDITYEAEDQETMPADLPLSGRWTIDSFSRHMGEHVLFPTEPVQHGSHDYRRWAFESAALDLALRQAETNLGTALGRPYEPVRFVVSTRLDIESWRALYPELEFKLDPSSDWDTEQMAAVAATGRVRALDFKAYYKGTVVHTEPDPALYKRVAETFPDAILEDVACTDETIAALRGFEDRLSWDAPIHSLADIDALGIEPRYMNIKPSRFGSVKRLFEAIDACLERGIVLYGGGQFELGPGRSQIQALASLFYPDAPNDVAPGAYNAPDAQPGLPRSPLAPSKAPVGLGF